MVGAIEVQHHQMTQELAGEEDPLRWASAIAQWMHEHQSNQLVEFGELLRKSQMPWVELWLGALLGGFELEQQGEFYEGGVWLRC
jgi:predicted chitinase